MTTTTSIPEPTRPQSPEQARALRGLRLFEERGHEIVRISRHVYEVPGSGSEPYTVDYDLETCTCPDFSRRQAVCKHLYAVGIARASRRGGSSASVGETPQRAPRPVRYCEGCGAAAGSRSKGTGAPLHREADGRYFHINCRPGAVSGLSGLVGLVGA